MLTQDETHIPLIVCRLNNTVKDIGDIKVLLSKQTENLSSLLVLQDKYNNLQNNMIEMNKRIQKNQEDIEEKFQSHDSTIQELSKFSAKVYGGIYVALFLFTLIQSVFVWYMNDFTNRIEKIDTNLSEISKSVYILKHEYDRKHYELNSKPIK